VAWFIIAFPLIDRARHPGVTGHQGAAKKI